MNFTEENIDLSSVKLFEVRGTEVLVSASDHSPITDIIPFIGKEIVIPTLFGYRLGTVIEDAPGDYHAENESLYFNLELCEIRNHWVSSFYGNKKSIKSAHGRAPTVEV